MFWEREMKDIGDGYLKEDDVQSTTEEELQRV